VVLKGRCAVAKASVCDGVTGMRVHCSCHWGASVVVRSQPASIELHPFFCDYQPANQREYHACQSHADEFQRFGSLDHTRAIMSRSQYAMSDTHACVLLCHAFPMDQQVPTVRAATGVLRSLLQLDAYDLGETCIHYVHISHWCSISLVATSLADP
jgi:hypothetical protein